MLLCAVSCQKFGKIVWRTLENATLNRDFLESLLHLIGVVLVVRRRMCYATVATGREACRERLGESSQLLRLTGDNKTVKLRAGKVFSLLLTLRNNTSSFFHILVL